MLFLMALVPCCFGDWIYSIACMSTKAKQSIDLFRPSYLCKSIRQYRAEIASKIIKHLWGQWSAFQHILSVDLCHQFALTNHWGTRTSCIWILAVGSIIKSRGVAGLQRRGRRWGRINSPCSTKAEKQKSGYNLLHPRNQSLIISVCSFIPRPPSFSPPSSLSVRFLFPHLALLPAYLSVTAYLLACPPACLSLYLPVHIQIFFSTPTCLHPFLLPPYI